MSSSYQDMGMHLPRLAVTHGRLECTRNLVTPWSDVMEMVAAVSLWSEIEGELALLWRRRPTIAPASPTSDDTVLGGDAARSTT
jgi:hypothetical protein